MRILIVTILIFFNYLSSAQSELTFCGEQIPLSNITVNKKLKDAVKRMDNNFFKNNNKTRTKMYLDFFAAVLKQNNLPEDLKYIPITESLLSNSTSFAGASGYWQFMPGTGRDFNLVVAYDFDERMNVEKSTYAAVAFLKTLYSKTKNWANAVAAYNCGLGNVRKAQRLGGTNSYYFLQHLPAETREYVYRIIACKVLFEGYSTTNFTLAEEEEFLAASPEVVLDTAILVQDLAVSIPTEVLDSVKVEVLNKSRGADNYYNLEFQYIQSKDLFKIFTLSKGQYFPKTMQLIYSYNGLLLSCTVNKFINEGSQFYITYKKPI